MRKTYAKTFVAVLALSTFLGGCNGIDLSKANFNQDVMSGLLSSNASPTPAMTLASVETPEVAEQKIEVANSANTVNVGDDLPISRALIAKMLASAYNDLNAIDSFDRYIEFTDTNPDMWYDKYINAVFISELMQGSDNKFMPDQPVTLEQTQILLDKLDANNKIKLQINDGATRS